MAPLYSRLTQADNKLLRSQYTPPSHLQHTLSCERSQDPPPQSNIPLSKLFYFKRLNNPSSLKSFILKNITENRKFLQYHRSITVQFSTTKLEHTSPWESLT